jgi:hypothetical protein
MDLKQMAEECGLGYLIDEGDEFFVGPKLIALAEMISAAEREACAKAVEATKKRTYSDCSGSLDMAAKAIRKRSNDQGNGPRQAQLAEGPR